MLGQVRRWGLGVTGGLLVVVGIILFPLPGPGLLLFVLGFGLLAREFEWAERRVELVRDRALVEARRGVATHRRAWTSMTVCALLAASGLLWVWAPAQPDWWALPDWAWLPGGLLAGLSQLLSGLVSLGLMVWTYVSDGAASGTLGT